MDSVKDSTEEEIVVEEAADIDSDIPTVDKVLAEEPVIEEETVVEEAVESEAAADADEENFLNVDDMTSDSDTVAAEEEVSASADNDIIEDTIVEETAIDRTADEVSFAEVDNLDNSLSQSNLEYLSKESSDSSETVNKDLKQDIKSVLLYMDQLLENLPEEKIVEFAKSDEFVTYKKLFSELGLS